MQAAIPSPTLNIPRRRSRARTFRRLDSLVAMVDNRDGYTGLHSLDVSRHAVTIARALGWGRARLEVVRVAGLLHDVGKIGVPDHVLRKPGRLTEREFRQVREHPQFGAVIVEAFGGFEACLPAIRHHHERWDGGGYPFGLAGEETPLLARLMAVADGYSAMTTDRPYRKGMCPGEARLILAEGAGGQWCPLCVAAFLEAARPDDGDRAASSGPAAPSGGEAHPVVTASLLTAA